MTRPKKPDPRPRSGKHLNAGVLVRAPDAEREAWAAEARREGMERAPWLRRLANDRVAYMEACRANEKRSSQKRLK